MIATGARNLRRGLIVRVVAFAAALPAVAHGQSLSQRGFVDARGFLYPQDAPNDSQNTVGDLWGREEVFAKPRPWIQFAAGLDARANTDDQVDASWHIDFRDRTVQRPALSIRRLAATIARGRLTLDAGKQFIRWGKTDIVTPTDRFAPRDFMNVVDAEYLAVTGVRAVVATDANTFEAVWVPWFTPSRAPLLDQRWTAVPTTVPPLTLEDGGRHLPEGSQAGVRWGHTTAAGLEYSASYFNGFNHLPDVTIVPGSAPTALAVVQTYPAIRSYGGDLAAPTRWFTVKAEGAYTTSDTPGTDDFIVYVVQLERQTGEWVLVGGYAGEVVTVHRAAFVFAPDRGLTKALLARAAYTIDTNRSVALETAVRQNGAGVDVRGEYSQARGAHWRVTLTGAFLAGHHDDFLGQYRDNSHVSAALRYSF